jgi:hypothetical protein
VFDTVAEIAFAVTLILPGFLVVQLSERRRASRPAGGDLELVLRGLVYALIIQALAVLSTWLPHLIKGLSNGPFWAHASALALYALVVCIVVPTVTGLALGWWLRKAEGRGGQLSWFHYALGARDSRRAWDYAFSTHDGSWVRVFLRSSDAGFLGKLGKDSWVPQSPSQPDLYLQEVWPLDADGFANEEETRHTGSGMWIDGVEIARIEFLPPELSLPPDPSQEPEN